MSFGSRSSPPPPPSYQPPPPPPEMPDVIDKINGVQMIEVKGANGKDQWVREQLPLTPEQQARKKFGRELLDKSLGEIIKLNQYDPLQAVDFAPVTQALDNAIRERQNDMATLSNFANFDAEIQKIAQNQRNAIDKDYDLGARELKARLSTDGYRGSSAEAEALAFLQGHKSKAYEQSLEGLQGRRRQELMDRDFQLQQRERQREANLRDSQTNYNTQLQQQQILDQRRQQAMQNQMNLFQIGSELEGSDYKKTLASKAPELALAYHQQNSADSLSRYTAGVQAQNAAYQNQMAHYNASKPGTSFLDGALNMVGTAGGIWLGNQASNPSPAPAFNSKGIRQVPVNQVGVLRNGY